MSIFLGAATLAAGIVGWRAWGRRQHRKAVSAALRRSVAVLESLDQPQYRAYRLMGY